MGCATFHHKGLDRMDNSLWEIESHDRFVVVRLKSQDIPFSTDAAAFRVGWEALNTTPSDAMQVILFRVPDGYLSPRMLDAFWENAHDETPDPRQYAFASGRGMRPPALARAHGTVKQTLQLLRSFGGITIASIEGEVDFDAMGYVLVCRHRICAKNTVFINRTLQRCVSPGSGTPWFLSRLLGEGRARQVYFREASLTAEQALELGIVHQICDNESLEAESFEVARRYATFDPAAIKSFLRSWELVHLDLFTYLEQAGTGFDVLPPKD
jgi:hypothetical protein